MAFVIADRVRETTTTTGTGNLTLDGAVSKFRTFASVLSSSDTTYYSIVEQTGTAWEVGIGTFTSPSTLARTTILSSSNGGSIVTFTAGTKDVFISLPASKTNVEDQPNLIEVNSSSDALRITQTGTGNALVVEDSANPDSSPFVVDASGNVGIGTSSPDATRALTLNRAGNYGGIELRVNGSTQARIQQESTGSLYIDSGITTTTGSTIFRTANGSERMRIDSSGNVGIGTSSPGSKLEVNQGILTINTSDQSLTRLQLKTTGSGGRTYEIVGGLPGTNNSQLSFYDATAAATRMTIDSSGNVGIGTSSPGSLLTVNGNLAFNSGYGSAAVAYGCRAWVNFDGTGTVAIRASGNVTSITDNGTGDYTVNFTTAMPDANYSILGTGKSATNAYNVIQQNSTTAQTTTAVRVASVTQSSGTPTAFDSAQVNIAIIR